jgi:HD-like signal output (HDOD) protein
MEHSEETSQPLIIEKLLKKMDASPGFAGLGGAVQNICRLVDDDGSNKDLVAAILRDPALTSKLLQIANSGSNSRGGRNVSKIDQVLAILGLNTVKSVALSLALLGSLPHKSQAKQLHAEIVAAFFSGSLAAEITRAYGSNYSIQEAQICGLMQNLGRMMAIFYLYEDIERSRKLQTDRNITESEAVLQTFGISFEDIGSAIASHWALPDVLRNSLAPDTLKSPPQAAGNADAWYQLCSLFSRRVTDVLFRFPENRESIEVSNCIDFFIRSLHLREKEVLETIEKCLAETDKILAGMTFPCDVSDARNLLRKASEQALDTLSAHDTLVKEKNADGGKTPIEVIKHVMRLIHSHYGFDCTLICLPTSNSGLLAIAGVGRNTAQLTTKFRSSGTKQDIFQLIMSRGVDAYISDITLPKYASLIPAWYCEVVGAQSFVMLPLMNEGKLIGMIYGDFSKPQTAPPSGLAEGEMLEWRKQLIQAIGAGSKAAARP